VSIVDAHPVELVLPDEPAPVRLMNSTWVDRDGSLDALGEVSDLRTFLSTIGRPVPSDLSASDLAAMRELRTALRTVAAVGPAAPSQAEGCAALETINVALSHAPAVDVLIAASGVLTLSREDGSSFSASLSRLAREGAEVLADRSRPLGTCPAPGCGLYFVRRHGRRRWCSNECGNRVRAARFYQRHRGSRSS
jgi:predicted RNA-binding Zn ribbon-like protein